MRKLCKKCGLSKNLDEFYKNKRMIDGYLNVCKNCYKKQKYTYYKNNVEYYKEYKKNNSKKIKEYRKKYFQVPFNFIRKKVHKIFQKLWNKQIKLQINYIKFINDLSQQLYEKYKGRDIIGLELELHHIILQKFF